MKKMIKIMVICLVVMFTTNAYAALIVYNNNGSQYYIDQALTYMGISYTEMTSIDSGDLSAGDVLLIPWNNSGNMSGLDSTVWNAITGNILITGQDVDVHAYNGTDQSGSPGSTVAGYAQTFLSQAIDFAGEQGGVGLVALGDYSTAFSYLPSAWGISATGSLLGETISSFTAEGLASGVFDGLTPGNLSNWGQSYHADFQSWDPRFEVFAMHSSIREYAVTIGHVVPVPAALLLGVLGLSVAGVKLRKFV